MVEQEYWVILSFLVHGPSDAAFGRSTNLCSEVFKVHAWVVLSGWSDVICGRRTYSHVQARGLLYIRGVYFSIPTDTTCGKRTNPISRDVYSIHADGFVKCHIKVYLVHLMLPVGWSRNPEVYIRSMQGWFCQVGVYLVHLMLPVGGGHRHRKGAPNPTWFPAWTKCNAI